MYDAIGRKVIVASVWSTRARALEEVEELENAWVRMHSAYTYLVLCYQDENPGVVENKPTWM